MHETTGSGIKFSESLDILQLLGMTGLNNLVSAGNGNQNQVSLCSHSEPMFAFALVLSTIHENALAKAKRETTGNGPIRCWEHNFNLSKIISIISTTNVDKLCFASGARVGTQLRETQLVKDRLTPRLK